MGIIAHETRTTEHGIDVSDYYINVGEIKISKQTESLTMFNVWTDYNCYANKDSRLTYKDPFIIFTIHLETETLDNIHAQIYTKIKETHGTSTDDL
jgi:hypothetical protein